MLKCRERLGMACLLNIHCFTEGKGQERVQHVVKQTFRANEVWLFTIYRSPDHYLFAGSIVVCSSSMGA